MYKNANRLHTNLLNNHIQEWSAVLHAVPVMSPRGQIQGIDIGYSNVENSTITFQ